MVEYAQGGFLGICYIMLVSGVLHGVHVSG